MTIRLFIADDHAMMREGLRKIIERSGTMRVIGEAANGAEILDSINDMDFDLLIMDMSMPGMGAVDLIGRVRAMRRGLPILVLSMHNTGKIAAAALKAGANGYITKDTDPDRLLDIIRKTVCGGSYVERHVADRIVIENAGTQPLPHSLTERENQILRMIADGVSTKQAADKLGLTPQTVSTHKKRIMEKMAVTNTAALLRTYIEHHYPERHPS